MKKLLIGLLIGATTLTVGCKEYTIEKITNKVLKETEEEYNKLEEQNYPYEEKTGVIEYSKLDVFADNVKYYFETLHEDYHKSMTLEQQEVLRGKINLIYQTEDSFNNYMKENCNNPNFEHYSTKYIKACVYYADEIKHQLDTQNFDKDKEEECYKYVMDIIINN